MRQLGQHLDFISRHDHLVCRVPCVGGRLKVACNIDGSAEKSRSVVSSKRVTGIRLETNVGVSTAIVVISFQGERDELWEERDWRLERFMSSIVPGAMID